MPAFDDTHFGFGVSWGRIFDASQLGDPFGKADALLVTAVAWVADPDRPDATAHVAELQR
ncbi:hypothetical protein D3C80_2107690 [compost metagenome]